MEVRHAPRRLPRLGLLGRFTLLSLSATVLLGVLLGHVLEHEVKRRAINNAANSAQLVASFGVLPQLSYTDLQNGLSPDAIPGLDRTFLAGYQDRSVVSLAVVNDKGKVVYSNLHARIGRTVPMDAALRSTLAGRAHAAVVHRIDGRPSAEALIETRAPLRFGPSAGPADGVFEIYTRYAPVAADITPREAPPLPGPDRRPAALLWRDLPDRLHRLEAPPPPVRGEPSPGAARRAHRAAQPLVLLRAARGAAGRARASARSAR